MPAPIGFSECTAHDADTLYYVDWLTDDQSFPSLSPSSAIYGNQEADWHIIEEQELDLTEQNYPRLVTKPVSLHTGTGYLAEFDMWENIEFTSCPESFAKLAADAQNQLADVQQLLPFPPIHPQANLRTFNAPGPDNVAKQESECNDDWYHLYVDHKSHGSHSHFGNKHYIKRQRELAIEDLNKDWESRYREGGPPDVAPRTLYQLITFRTHAKQYKPPGPRNANKNKEKGHSISCTRLD
ncbi:hypothetical protein [Absidia glauca]|uniref:Uncharacterized protein n=1 Tax=Absidia glauca TaxID=4829 RepID=A0A163J0M6_ABSGL|nr:hypothetical protein [Absidia glauca]